MLVNFDAVAALHRIQLFSISILKSFRGRKYNTNNCASHYKRSILRMSLKVMNKFTPNVTVVDSVDINKNC